MKRADAMVKMYLVGVIILSALLSITSADAQFKKNVAGDQKISESLVRPVSLNEWFGLINPDNLFMRQSYSMSYMTSGGQGLALGRYTNSLIYKMSSTVDAQVDISLQHSPYSTLDRRIQNNLSGIFIDRAQINYRPSDKVLLQVSYQQLPWGYWGPYRGMYSGFGLEGY
jgi:hypothetical protein